MIGWPGENGEAQHQVDWGGALRSEKGLAYDRSPHPGCRMGTLTPHPVLSSFHTHLLPCPPHLCPLASVPL